MKEGTRVVLRWNDGTFNHGKIVVGGTSYIEVAVDTEPEDPYAYEKRGGRWFELNNSTIPVRIVRELKRGERLTKP